MPPFDHRLQVPQEQDHDAPPINPLPALVVLLAVAIFGLEMAFTIGSTGMAGPAATGWRIAALESYAFGPQFLDWMTAHQTLRWDYVARFFTYAFVNPSFTYTLFVLVFVLSLGKMVGETMSGLAVLVVFVLSSAAGALALGIIASGTQHWLAGGFPGAYGLVGAFTFVLWAGLGERRVSRLRAFALIAFLLGIQLIYGLAVSLFGQSATMASWDWPARLAGFGTGFVLSFVLAPGGWKAVLAHLRRR